MRRSPRVLVTWIAAVVVALVTARVVATDLATLHRRAGDLGPMRDVVVAAADLPLGATVRPADLSVVRMYESTVPKGALRDRRAAVGRVVAVPVLRDNAVVARHLVPARRSGLDGLVPDGSRAIRVVTDDGLRPRAGQVVDVLVSLDPSMVAEAGGGDGALTVAKGARVLAVDGGTDAVEAARSPGVTLLVTEQEAHAVAFATANGALMLALAPPEAACCTDPLPDARPH